MSSYQATPEQWAVLEERSAPEYDNTILELRARVELLEATQHAHIETVQPSVKESLTVAPAPAGSLVERLAKSIRSLPENTGISDWSPEARVAIREVAAAALVKDLNGQAAFCPTWKMVAQWLEQEAER